MLVRCVVVGISHFHDLTLPFVEGLAENNQELNIAVIDNESEPPYPESDAYELIRTARCGYGQALNIGADDAWFNWLLCCNNDCICDGNIMGIIKRLSDDTIYGNAWKLDYSGMERGLPAVVDSAYLLIPRKIWHAIGPFDVAMDAAFEEIDYQIRALDAGFRVDVADLPITHLSLHTRHELKDYWKRWGETERKFLEKYPARKYD